MDFSLTSRQKTLADRAAVAAQYFRCDSEVFAGSQGWRAAAADGWMGLCLRTGSAAGYSALEAARGFEALGEAGAARGPLFAAGAHLFGAAKAIDLYAREPARQAWVSGLRMGELVGALALTEPTGGSEMTCEGTTLEESKSGELMLRGTKTYVTNATTADLLVVLAREPGMPAPLNLTVVAVSGSAVGLERCAITTGRGLQGADMGSVAFDCCPVSQDQVLGRRGSGLGIVLSVMQWERTCILAGALGVLARDFDTVRTALRARKNKGGALTRHQAVSHTLSEIWARIETARLMLYRSAWEIDEGGDALLYSALSKYTLAKTLLDCAVELQRLMGGAGWANEGGLGDGVQDAMAMVAASGTAEAQLNMISARIGLGATQ